MTNAVRAILFALCGSSLFFSPSVAADQRAEVEDRQGRVVRVQRGDGSPLDVAPSRLEQTTPERPLASEPGRGAGHAGVVNRALASPETWPMFQADARHTGYLPVSLDPALFSFTWQKNVGTNFPLNPVTAGDGKVFVTLLTYFNDMPSLFALRSLDGTTLWSKGFGSVFSVNPPSYAYGKVYLQTGKSTDGTVGPILRALDAATGAPVFQAPYDAQWERYYAPTIDAGKVYVDGGVYGGMYGFDATTGAQLWFADLPQYDQWTPALAGGIAYAYVGEYEPGLYGFDRATGAPVLFIPDPDFVWNGWSMDMAPSVGAHDDVIAIHDGRLICFDTALGTIRWQVQDQYAGQPSVAHGRIYAFNGSRLYVVDELTHAELWWWQPPAGSPTGPVIVTDTHIFVSTADAVYAVDLATGLSVWSYPAGGYLALADSTLFVASSNGVLTAITVPYLLPAALAVHDPGGNANGILEPGETAEVRTSWRAGLIGVSAVTGSGQASGDVALVDASATYGDIAPGATVSCADRGDCYGITISGARPATHWDVTLQETLSTGDRHDWLLHIGASFSDVPASSPYYPFVETLLHRGATAGCGVSTYCPANPTPRAHMAVLDLLSKEGSGYQPPPCGGTPMFSDVPIPNTYCRWIEELARRGVTAGCGGGRYCPADPVTREQATVFALRTLEPTLDPPPCTTPLFSDVPATSPYCRWIEELARRGVTAGCGGGKYCPANPATREQEAVVLTRAFGLSIYVP